MACILLSKMDTSSADHTEHQNSHMPVPDPAVDNNPKEDLDTTCLTVHLYCLGKDVDKDSESVLSFPPGEYVVEELCIAAAKACSKSQVDLSVRTEHRPRTPLQYAYHIMVPFLVNDVTGIGLEAGQSGTTKLYMSLPLAHCMRS